MAWGGIKGQSPLIPYERLGVVMEFEAVLVALVEASTLSGFEKSAFSRVKALAGSYFDSVEADSAGNVILRRWAMDSAAPTLMLDAHLDEIGFVVSGYSGGFVEVVPSGGLDPVVFEGMEVTVHGKSPTPGVLGTQGEGDGRRNYVFTGLPEEELCSRTAVGDAVTFRSPITRLQNRRLVGHAFDDKACAAALLCAVASIPREELSFNAAVVLSTREEVAGGGAACAAEALRPWGAVVTDVNFATAPGVPADESGELGRGPMVSLSAVTDRQVTDLLLSVAEESGIPVTTVVESYSTGTNASHVYVAGDGIPCGVLSLPLSGMHTASECLCLDDVEGFMRIISGILQKRLD